MLTEKQISKFQELYKKNFGKEISRDEALEKGIKIVELIKLVYQPNIAPAIQKPRFFSRSNFSNSV